MAEPRRRAAAEPAEPRSTKGQRTRAVLLAAAKKVFERDGFLLARVADIANEAKVAHGSFYHYFSSKEQIFREIAEVQEVSLLAMDDIGGGPNRTTVERIRAANRAYLDAYRREAKIMREIEAVSRYDESVRAVRTKRDDEFAVRLQASIERMQKAGEADPTVDSRYAAYALGCMVSRFAEIWLIGGGEFDMDKAVDQLTRLWVNAIGLKPERLDGIEIEPLSVSP